MQADRRQTFRLPKSDWLTIYLANGIAAGAILLTCWIGLCVANYYLN